MQTEIFQHIKIANYWYFRTLILGNYKRRIKEHLPRYPNLQKLNVENFSNFQKCLPYSNMIGCQECEICEEPYECGCCTDFYCILDPNLDSHMCLLPCQVGKPGCTNCFGEVCFRECPTNSTYSTTYSTTPDDHSTSEEPSSTTTSPGSISYTIHECIGEHPNRMSCHMTTYFYP